MKSVLLVGGFDTSQGAGVAMDARVAARLGAQTEICLTSLAVQSHDVSLSLVPIEAASFIERLARIPPATIGAVKLGALGSLTLGSLLLRFLQNVRAPLIVDPVLRTTSGGRLVAGTPAAIRRFYRESLGPLATLLTPNLPEALFLLERRARDFASPQEMAQALERRMGCPVLLKGGHAKGRVAEDLLCQGGKVRRFAHERLGGHRFRGTGCALATAIACHLLGRKSLDEAVLLALSEHQMWMRRKKKGGEKSPALLFLS